MQGIGKIVEIVFALIVCLSLAAVAILAFDNEPANEITKIVYFTPAVKPGGTLTVIRNIVRRRSCETVAYRTIRDGAGALHLYDPRHVIINAPASKIGLSDTLTSDMLIPRSANPGEAEWRVTLEWKCNWVQKWFDWPIVVMRPPIKFMIE